MSEKSEALLNAAMDLDPDERRWLAEALWQSFDDDEEVLALAKERLAEMESGAVGWVTHEELMASLRR